jgi:putative addiction module component (TIGR02574 family)
LEETVSGERQAGKFPTVNTRVYQILDEALGLARVERSALVVALLESLEGGEDPVISEAWGLEIRRRRLALQAGTTAPAAWSDAKARLRSL